MCYKRNNYTCGHIKETPIPTCETPRIIETEPSTTKSLPASIRSVSSHKDSSSRPRSPLSQVCSHSEDTAKKLDPAAAKEKASGSLRSFLGKASQKLLPIKRVGLDKIFDVDSSSRGRSGIEKILNNQNNQDGTNQSKRNSCLPAHSPLESFPSIPTPLSLPTINLPAEEGATNLKIGCLSGDGNGSEASMNRQTIFNSALLAPVLPWIGRQKRRSYHLPVTKSVDWLSLDTQSEPPVIGNFDGAIGRPLMTEKVGRQRAYTRSKSVPVLSTRDSELNSPSTQEKALEDNKHAWLSLDTDVPSPAPSMRSASPTPSIALSSASSKFRHRLSSLSLFNRSSLSLFNRSKSNLDLGGKAKVEIIPCKKIVLLVESGIPCPDCMPDFSSGRTGTGVLPPYVPGTGGWKWQMSDRMLEIGAPK